MPATTTIAILGACSKNGKTASRKLSVNNRLLLLDHNKEELLQLKNELEAQPANGIEIMECFLDTGWEADAIVLAVQTDKDEEAFNLMKPYVTGKKVIVFASADQDMNEIQSLLPYSKVISINEADCDCVNKVDALLKETF